MKLIKMSFIKFLILGFVLVFAKNVFAQMPTDKESVSKIFSAINTLSGNFEFVYELDIADEKVKNGGQFYFQKPSKLKWVQNYQQKTGFLMDGQKVVFWKVDANGNKVLEDISKKSFARRFATFLYAFVSMDFDVLQKAYDVEFRDDRIVFLP
ncbi:MAG: outer-membrane lipoprotein carrier protein LolA, partial [Elusimicrobiota bacterium]|nr:outer-membrane lipoprotein carrier protein LolA [Elusimicrobiota bacterium]